MPPIRSQHHNSKVASMKTKAQKNKPSKATTLQPKDQKEKIMQWALPLSDELKKLRKDYRRIIVLPSRG
ncbi:hypothetical protein DSO57_1012488 [Entomophthora muscae]|uniref:Uncharacterized protein n=1 Tax=Entomophthora muscae TaxID=34485 RepID=A0ACC2SIS2_9FUNG|nr:hypothetical protein DSO57_1012488 [Entomophthora muscae]